MSINTLNIGLYSDIIYFCIKNMKLIQFVMAFLPHNKLNNSFLEKKYGENLKDIIEMAETIIETKKALVKEGRISLTEAKQAASFSISQLRYDNGAGYIWINNTALPACLKRCPRDQET